jgi:hypothetical protein
MKHLPDEPIWLLLVVFATAWVLVMAFVWLVAVTTSFALLIATSARTRRLWHRIQHRMGWCYGKQEHWVTCGGKVMVGFRCQCGALLHIQPLEIYEANKAQTYE